MRLALVCPHLPPRAGGVADYTSRLAREFSAQGHAVSIWTGEPSPLAIPGVEIRNVAGPGDSWPRSRFAKLTEGLRAWRPDAVIFQFTPYLYGPKTLGINVWLPHYVHRLNRWLGVPVGMVAHEMHYPVGLSPDRLLVGFPQWLQFLVLALVSDFVFFSFKAALERAKSWLPWRASRFEWLPVGATIEPQDGAELAPEGSPEGVNPKTFILLQFGSAHPSRLFALSLAALGRVRRELAPREAKLVFVGLTQSEVDRLVGAGRAQGTGYLSASEVSRWLGRADLVLAPFIDGISARRSSAMVALAHGKPLLTTSGWCTLPEATDPATRWPVIAAVTEATEPQHFAARAAELALNPAKAAQLASEGRMHYERAFSWRVIAARMAAFLR